MTTTDPAATDPAAIAYRYDPERNPDVAYLIGVPHADLTVGDVQAQPVWVRRAIAACPFYVATAFAPAVAPEPASDAPPAPVEVGSAEVPADADTVAGAAPARQPRKSVTKEADHG